MTTVYGIGSGQNSIGIEVGKTTSTEEMTISCLHNNKIVNL
jgi:hypothetical protein